MSEVEHVPEAGGLLAYAGRLMAARQGDLFRDGATLIARDGVELIPVCILCGDAAGTDRSVRLSFTWDPSFQVTKTSTLQLRRSAVIHARLCRRHYRRWRGGRMGGLLGMAAAGMWMAGCAIVAVISESSDVPRYTPLALAGLFAGFAAFIGWLFLFTLRTRTLRCERIAEGYVYLAGAHERFLEQVPGLPAARGGDFGSAVSG